jgi:hypothetical protein
MFKHALTHEVAYQTLLGSRRVPRGRSDYPFGRVRGLEPSVIRQVVFESQDGMAGGSVRFVPARARSSLILEHDFPVPGSREIRSNAVQRRA